MNFIFLVVPVVAVLLLLLAIVYAKARNGGAGGKYKRRDIMTENELEFFGRLVAALPEHYIFPQVAMSALLQSASLDRKRAHSDRLRIAQQRVDYVVCNKRCDIIAVVELDDRTHSHAKDQLRDGRLEQGGIRTVRFQSRQKPAAAAIRAAILPAAAPAPAAAAEPAVLSATP